MSALSGRAFTRSSQGDDGRFTSLAASFCPPMSDAHPMCEAAPRTGEAGTGQQRWRRSPGSAGVIASDPAGMKRTTRSEESARIVFAPGRLAAMLRHAVRWLLNDPRAFPDPGSPRARRVDPLRAAPLVAMHAGCLLVAVVGVSPVALWVCAGLYVARMLFITAFFHRYFSHRAFRASRAATLAMAVLGCTAGQRGPLWWAAHHRGHHHASDTPADPHSPRHHGRWYSHTLWFLTPESFATPAGRVRDWMRHPELRLVERIDWLPFAALGAACAALGGWLESTRPDLGTSAGQMFVWGFVISTVLLYHATYTINSLAHGWGSRRYDTPDDSRNNAFLSAITLGEGWHNNHHRYPASARQGFRWWEIDATWLFLRLLAALGFISDLKPVPARVIADGNSRSSRTPPPGGVLRSGEALRSRRALRTPVTPRTGEAPASDRAPPSGPPSDKMSR